jgi:phenylacetate-CoA ligase
MANGLLTLIQVLIERRAQERSCRWTSAMLRDHQARSLARLRSFAYGASPFYRDFHRGLENAPLERLPIITKPILMENFDHLVTDRSIRLADAESFLASDAGTKRYLDRYVVLATSGSTGRRGVFIFAPREWVRAIAAITRPIAWAMQGRSQRPPRAALIASRANWHYSARVGAALQNRLAPALRLDAATPIGELVAALNEWRPEAIATYPSVLRELAAAARAGELRIPLRHVATSAEVLTDEVREAVRGAWDIKVQDTYGATEYAPISSECPLGRKHLFENGAIVEVVDDAGQAVPAGQSGARLLLTVFERWTQPLIRYELSDLVRLSDEPCPCGLPYRTLDFIEGRKEDILRFPMENDPGTVAIHPNQFHEILERTAVDAWQVERTVDAVNVRLVGRNAAVHAPDVAARVTALIRAAGAAALPVRIQIVDRLERGPSGKAPLIVSAPAFGSSGRK